MLRLLNANIFNMDSNFFSYLDWLSGGLKTFLGDVINAVEDAPKSADRDEALEALHDAEGWFRNRLKNYFDDLVSENPCICEAVRQSAIKLCEAVANFNAYDAEERVRARKQLKKAFGLDNLSLDLFEFVYYHQTSRGILDGYFTITLEIWKGNNRDILARVLDTNRGELEKTLAELSAFGILDIDLIRGRSLDDAIVPIWETPDTHDASTLFCVPVKGETLPLEKFRISEDDLRYVKKLLTAKGSIPVNIMLYGPPGTGKTTFARSLARQLGLKVWSVNNDEELQSMNRRTALVACLNLASRHKDSFVLVDEAEKVLNTGFGGNQDKGWLNTLLEKPGNRVIWITNYVHHINPAVRRRFSFSVYFGALGQNERRSLWEEIIARQRAEKYFTKEQTDRLAKGSPPP